MTAKPNLKPEEQQFLRECECDMPNNHDVAFAWAQELSDRRAAEGGRRRMMTNKRPTIKDLAKMLRRLLDESVYSDKAACSREFLSYEGQTEVQQECAALLERVEKK